VHDEQEQAVVGDIVAIEYAGRKLSKRKAFSLTEIVYEAEKYKHPVTGQIFTRPAASVPLDYAINKN
jgi:glycine cleavage system H lipoate-binding protein